MKFKKQFEEIGEKKGFTFTKESRVKPEFKEESDINNMMARYAAGIEEVPQMPQYDDILVDVTDVPDFMTMQNKLNEAAARFEAMPSKIRKYFDNSPTQMLQFISDPANKEECVRLGIFAAVPNRNTDILGSSDVPVGSADINMQQQQ